MSFVSRPQPLPAAALPPALTACHLATLPAPQLLPVVDDLAPKMQLCMGMVSMPRTLASAKEVSE